MATYSVNEGQRYLGTFETLADAKEAARVTEYPFDRTWRLAATPLDNNGKPVNVYLGRGLNEELNFAVLFITVND